MRLETRTHIKPYDSTFDSAKIKRIWLWILWKWFTTQVSHPKI